MARNWNTTHRWLSTRCGYRYLPTPSKKCKHCTIWDLWILLQSLELDAIEKITGYRIHRHLVIMMRTALGGNCGKLLQLCVLATLECLRIVYGSHVGLDIPCRSSLKVEAHWMLAYHIWQSHWPWICLVEAHWSVYGSHVGLDIPCSSMIWMENMLVNAMIANVLWHLKNIVYNTTNVHHMKKNLIKSVQPVGKSANTMVRINGGFCMMC